MENVIDTLLHELAHIIWGAHDVNFHNLWNELRDEHQILLMKGYTGEGFLGQGQKLGGRRIPLDEMRRQARIAAEKRKSATKASAGGHRLGGTRPIQRGVDMRKVIADAASRRNSITEGCASGSANAGRLVNQQEQDGFRTTAEQDDANDWAIAQALQDLMFDEEMQRLGAPTGNGGLAWDPENGLSFDSDPPSRTASPSSDLGWTRDENGNLHTTEPPNWAYPTRSTSYPSPLDRPMSRLVTQSSSSRGSQQNSYSRSSREEEQRRNKQLPPTPPRSSPPRQSRPPIPPHSHSQPLPHPTPQPTPPTIPISHNPNPDEWACPQCTLHNPLDYLACAVCGLEQPPQPIPEHRRFVSSGLGGSAPSLPKPPPQSALRGQSATPFEPARGRLGWNCLECGTFMETQWWTCSLCGTMKLDS